MPSRGTFTTGVGAFVGCALALHVGPAAERAESATFEPFKPDRSRAMPVIARMAGEAAPPLPTCRTNLVRQLRTLDVPGLAAAIVKSGRIVCVAAAGLANIEQEKPVTADTLFLIASVSKTITGTALMQLRDQRKFRLDDEVNAYLPFKVVVPAAPAAPITFRQLLTHTSSIADNTKYINCPGSCAYGSSLGELVTRGADSPISLADLTKGYLTQGGTYYDRAANFKPSAPGTVAEYSNMGIVLAGYLVELLGGMPFDRYCKEQIFTPLGMETSSWRLDGIDRSLLAMPYDKASTGYVPYGHYGEPDYPDGMLRTSVKELGYFLLSYIQGGQYNGQRVLKSRTVREILKRQSSLDRSQGLVWVSQSISGRLVWGHDGADNGAGAQMWFDPAKSEGVVLLTNGIWTDDDSALLAMLFQEADRY
jgi:CubicO group peptidase (beta-lactamase class C family)